MFSPLHKIIIMSFAPIVVFAFNRLSTLKMTINSLLANLEAPSSDLLVFVDGPRDNTDGDLEKVQSVREYVKSITGFQSVVYHFSDKNKGLANSIIDGSTEVLNQFGRIIVLEDDLIVSRSFLRFMNEMLDKYKNDERIMQVSGYGCLLTRKGNYPYDVYINRRGHSWSWGTWKDRWDTVDWNVNDFAELSSSKKKQRSFNEYGSDLFAMLNGYMTHKNNSWYIRFNYSMHKQQRFSVMPIKSLVRNDGFGADATNCTGWNVYRVDFEIEHDGAFVVPDRIEPSQRIMKNAVRYWSLPYRIYRKIRSIITL